MNTTLMKNLSLFLGSLGLLIVGLVAFNGLGSADYASETKITTSGMAFHMPRMTKLSHLKDDQAIMHYRGAKATIRQLPYRCLNGFEGCVLNNSHQRNTMQNLSIPHYRAANAQFKHTIQGNYDLQTATMTLLVETASHAQTPGRVISRYYVTNPGKGLFLIEVSGNVYQEDSVLDLAYVLQKSFRIIPTLETESEQEDELSEEVRAVIRSLEEPTVVEDLPTDNEDNVDTPEEAQVQEVPSEDVSEDKEVVVIEENTE